MQQSPNTENRRPPSPRVFYPGSPKNNTQAESPSFINERSPSFSAPDPSDSRWDQGEKKIRKDLFNSADPERPKPPGPNGVQESIVPRHFDEVRTFDYSNQQPSHSSPVQFALKTSKKFIDYSSNPLNEPPSSNHHSNTCDKVKKSDKKHDKKRSSTSPHTRRSRSPRHKKKKSKDKTRSNSASPKRSRAKKSRHSRESPRKSTIDETEQDLYEIELNEDIPYVPMAVNPEEGQDEESNIITAETNVEIPKVNLLIIGMSQIKLLGICGYISAYDASLGDNDGTPKT